MLRNRRRPGKQKEESGRGAKYQEQLFDFTTTVAVSSRIIIQVFLAIVNDAPQSITLTKAEEAE
ncbi:hypothetical protein KIN20_002490 [Parelaphostrongylus tenuis]|uniref:Uncharacterized protein n=1 Tax=Parelaphostrongylus tenuis TaxID=148309 RepID=A0AAD5QFC6_PARTN|nr:hypothetical protein KIN20_002490 [Parelaphostrongylus tenuis]